MRALMRLLCCAVLALGWSAAAHAQANTDTYFYTPGGGGVNGAVGMCLNASNKAVPCSAAGVQPSPTSIGPYPSNLTTGVAATPVTASATGTTAATTATLPGAASKTTYLCGFSIDANATAAVAGNATVTGTISGTLNFTQGVAATPAVGSVNRTFNPCVPASAVNTGIAVNSIAPGTGGVVSVTAWGFQL